jgi:hypothetical protein
MTFWIALAVLVGPTLFWGLYLAHHKITGTPRTRENWL